jgi:predicted dehydrogenase
MGRTINWGILSTGRISEKFALDLQLVPNARLAAVGSRDPDRARGFAQKFNAEKAYGSYEELASDKDIDVIYIGTPHISHCENALLCLEKGKGVLCEKPFAMNEKEVLRMIAKARENNVFLMEAMWTRFIPAIRKVLELIKSGAIGDIVHIKADFGYRAQCDPEWRLFNKELGGGSLLDIGIYPVFLILLLIGVPDEIAADAIIGRTGVDELMSAYFKYYNGKMATLYSTLIANTPAEAEISGTKGHIRINRMWHMSRSLVLHLNDGQSESFEFSYKGTGYQYEAEEVTSCLQKDLKESDLLPLELSLRMIRVLDMIRKKCGITYQADGPVFA